MLNMKRVKEYQVLIAGISVALSLLTAAFGCFSVAYTFGQAVGQHKQLMDGQAVILKALHDGCK